MNQSQSWIRFCRVQLDPAKTKSISRFKSVYLDKNLAVGPVVAGSRSGSGSRLRIWSGSNPSIPNTDLIRAAFTPVQWKRVQFLPPAPTLRPPFTEIRGYIFICTQDPLGRAETFFWWHQCTFRNLLQSASQRFNICISLP